MSNCKNYHSDCLFSGCFFVAANQPSWTYFYLAVLLYFKKCTFIFNVDPICVLGTQILRNKQISITPLSCGLRFSVKTALFILSLSSFPSCTLKRRKVKIWMMKASPLMDQGKENTVSGWYFIMIRKKQFAHRGECFILWECVTWRR